MESFAQRLDDRRRYPIRIGEFFEVERIHFKNIHVVLKYGKDKNEKVITGLKRVSKPGLRQYAKVNEIPKVLNGLGIVVLSTSQGLMTDKEARAKNIGGEVLAYIW